MTTIIASFGLCLLAFTLIGLLSARRRQPTSTDYLIAGRSVSPWLTALSSVATNNSGFMFIGLLGFTYRFGVQAVWLQLGWILGDLVVWMWVHGRVRALSGRLELASVPALLGTRDNGSVVRPTVVVTGALTFLFLGGYAAAQLAAGSTALNVLFGWDLRLGASIGAVIVALYCFSGGLRASIWTDAAQSIVMLASMALLLALAMNRAGGPPQLFASLEAIDPPLVRWRPAELRFGLGLYFLGFVAGGLGAVGQPHILIRSMAISSAEEIPRARRIYYLWFVPFSVAAVGAGLYARVLLPDLLVGAAPDGLAQAAESALPRLTLALMPEVLVGLMLAGIFSATMSTADSQILACSAAVTQDIAPTLRDSYPASKLATLAVTALALTIALSASDGVFALVLGAWSALGASLGPLLILRVMGRVPSAPVALVMMAAGVLTVFSWGASSLADDVFKLLPGLAVPLAIYAIYELVTRLGSRQRR
ncbi:Sodium/proline symporter [Enhygromyxa salina]|uniref:Sodium/proline symporter n=1 Tax=Enhygromyxa salina TaxID=215803 RepID=A0A2S9YDA9_9BACT|nr:sodium/proline symporter [Enhygromyxa salina]PRQ03001.1 Sodium/proline symporter [Enhygromyxa salina]